MIGIDQSEEMLCVVRDKAEQLGLSGRLLLLRQDLLKLDLYGTIRAAVSTFDTFNHIPDLDTAIANAGFFMEKGGVFLFDMNTPYKHQKVLGDNAFTFEEEDAHYPVAGVSRTGVRNHRGKGGVRLPRARRTGKVCTGNSTAAGTDHPLWQRTAFDKDHDGNGIHRHEGKKPAQQVAEFKIRVYA